MMLSCSSVGLPLSIPPKIYNVNTIITFFVLIFRKKGRFYVVFSMFTIDERHN
jgi:hypothetical protein